MVAQKGTVRVSVAMISYNGAEFLRGQVESVLEQLGQEDELVVSDDGSTDGTTDILQEYQSLDGRVRLLSGPRQGIKKNVQHVLQETRGRYIFLADQDDVWLPGKVERVLKAFETSKAAVVIHDAKVFAGAENDPQILMESFFAFRRAKAGVLKNIIKNSYIGCCMEFRRQLLSTILPIPEGIEMHDQWIGILGDYHAGKSCFLSEPLLLYRRHEDNNSAMSHYGMVRMIRNRMVFVFHFVRRALCKGACDSRLLSL